MSHDIKLESQSDSPRLIDCRYGPMLVNPNDTYIGRSLIAYGEYSPGEADLYRGVLGAGDLVVEAGANIGCFTVLFAQTVGAEGRVFAFEPQRLVFQMLCANLALNGLTNVEAWPAGIGAEIGQRLVPLTDYDVPSNFGGLALAAEGPGECVPITTIDNLGLEACTLIKADVQGMECEVLKGAADTIERCRPLLYLENDDRGKSEALLRTIDALGYRAFWHLPPLFAASNHRGEDEDLFPGVVSVNLLCTPPGVRIDFPGLAEVRGPEDWWDDK